jgi:hypothetical protein
MAEKRQVVFGRDIAIPLLKALGLDGLQIKDITLFLPMRGVASMKLEMHVTLPPKGDDDQQSEEERWEEAIRDTFASYDVTRRRMDQGG